MSTPQRNHACRITVSPSDADVLRPRGQEGLDVQSRDPSRTSSTTSPSSSWNSPTSTATRPPSSTPSAGTPTSACRIGASSPLTRAHIEQLHKRRADLLDTNLDLLTDIGADNTTNAIVMSDIYANRHSVEALNRVFDAYTNTITK